MEQDRLITYLTEQIKEAQLKLGFANEAIRLYFPAASLGRMLQWQGGSGKELVAALLKESRFTSTRLGTIRFSLCKDDRIEVCIPPEGAVYVRTLPDPPFLAGWISLFQTNHCLTIEEICAYFASFNPSYSCRKMEQGMDFDYVLYFPDGQPDAWYYCIRMELGHTIYHRFAKEDYEDF
ncbi:MAG: DUF3877 family protein [Eubacterium sp.]|nr:DUF3877 family protein [Eubacterium sp.]